jgi:Uncharacterized anaerobic dehydrogenase
VGLRRLPLHDPFAANAPERASPLIAARAPEPRLALNPEDAAALGLAEGDAALVDGAPGPAPVSLDAAIPRGAVGLSLGPDGPRGRAPFARVERAR